MVSRKWVATLCLPEETSTQVGACFLAALAAEGLLEVVGQPHRATAPGAAVRRAREDRAVIDDGQLPMLLAVSDNGPQMRLHSTREFLAGVHIARHFDDRTPTTDQAWIETLFGHVKGEWPHLEKITDPGDLAAELDRVRGDYNTVRLHASIGYVTPEDEHEGRGDAIRLRGRHGWNESAKNASTTVDVQQENMRDRTPNLVWVLIPQDVSSTQTHLTSIRRTYGPTLGCAARVAQ